VKNKHFDSVIIGFGKGGKTLAKDLSVKGEKVAVIERSAEMYGGTCINIGCIPTKSLVHNAKFAAAHGGWSFEQKADFYKKSIEEKRNLVSALNNKNFHMLADDAHIEVMTGEGAFVSPKEVEVTYASGNTERLSADKIFINTGAKEIIPKISGTDNKNVFTSRTLLNHQQLPKTLCIIGGGYIGLEFASIYSAFGTQVSVLEFSDVLIAREDRDMALAVQQRLEKKGVKFIFSADTKEIRQQGEDNVVVYTNKNTGEKVEIQTEAVLIAIGRIPNTQGLHPEAAGVVLTERGAVKTDEYLRTAQPHIWALGDVAGNEQFTYISLDDYRIILDQLNGEGSRTTLRRKPVHYSVFIDPPFSRAGISEQEAKAKGLDYAVATLEAAVIPRAKLMNETDGLLKAIVNKKDGSILGCTLFCTDSHEVINIVQAAIVLGAPYTFLRDFIFSHPSMGEALNDLFKKVNLK
jgi:pyruvate/2-oxoglutarate dehydrogenase complex dihydrolipoamide dehydrogenase (E3) component